MRSTPARSGAASSPRCNWTPTSCAWCRSRAATCPPIHRARGRPTTARRPRRASVAAMSVAASERLAGARSMTVRSAMARPAMACLALASLAVACLSMAACRPGAAPPAPAPSILPARAGTAASASAAASAPPWVAAARAQVGVTVRYDPSYVVLAYPAGDVPRDRGVCTDVVIRALRGSGLDLQQRVHEDMRAHFPRYPQAWGLRAPDRNIDHRRVPNLQRWFERQHWHVPTSIEAGDYRPGDLVTWTVDGNLPHIGIVSDRYAANGTPLVLHNVGAGTREEDRLFAYPITGHYRPVLPDQADGTSASSSTASLRR